MGNLFGTSFLTQSIHPCPPCSPDANLPGLLGVSSHLVADDRARHLSDQLSTPKQRPADLIAPNEPAHWNN